MCLHGLDTGFDRSHLVDRLPTAEPNGGSEPIGQESFDGRLDSADVPVKIWLRNLLGARHASQPNQGETGA